MHDSSKKSRRRASSDTTDSVAPACFNARPSSQKGPSLDTMPTEILQQILYASFEPRLIHTCRSLYERLPDYVGWIKSLDILAFAPRGPITQYRTPVVDLPIVDFPAVDVPVPGPKHFIDLDRINTEVCRSPWLTPALLQETHLTLFKKFVYTTILSPEVPLYRELREKIEQELHTLKDGNLYQSSNIPSLWPLRCPGNRFDGATIRISGFSVCIKWPRNHPGLSTSQYSWQFFRLFTTKMVPDCLVANTTDGNSCGFVRTLLDTCCPGELVCSHELMQKTIFEAMRDLKILQGGVPDEDDEDGNSFVLLRRLNHLCCPPAPLTAEMLALAVNQNDKRPLRYILGDAPQDHGKAIWDFGLEDLLRLELGLQRHQYESYLRLAAAISEQFKNDIGQAVAQKLGFGDVRMLEAARSAVRDMIIESGEAECNPSCRFPLGVGVY